MPDKDEIIRRFEEEFADFLDDAPSKPVSHGAQGIPARQPAGSGPAAQAGQPQGDFQGGQPVTIRGVARNAALGAVVIEDKAPVFIDGLTEWEPEVLGKRVEVKGVLRYRELSPPPTVASDGAVSHGMGGAAPVLEDAEWTVEP